jgi:membrane protease YdiL (CAAX protease family)
MINVPSKRLILTQIFIIFVLPVFLLYFKIVPVGWRMVFLAICSLIIYGIIRREEWSFEEMGIRQDNFKKALPFYLAFVVVGALTLFFVDSKVHIPDIDTPSHIIKTWIFFVPVSFFQEFAFRSFLIPRLKKLYSKNYIIIFFNAILFTLIHIIFPNLGIGLPIAFVSGIFFAWLYIKYPNLVLISLVHSVLNIIAVLLGFFVVS